MSRYYHIEESRIPGYYKFVSDLQAFPFACSIPQRLSEIKFPGGQDDCTYASFRRPGEGDRDIAVTRWKIELSDNFIFFNPYLEGKENFIWLVQRDMDRLRSEKTVQSYEIPKPQPTRLNSVLSEVVWVIYSIKGRPNGHRIYCKYPRSLKSVFWTITVEGDTPISAEEFTMLLMSIEWQ